MKWSKVTASIHTSIHLFICLFSRWFYIELVCVLTVVVLFAALLKQVPVIIAGNKLDLRLNNVLTTLSSSSQAAAAAAAETQSTTPPHHHPTDRQRIVALLQRYKFVRQCIKCSAKALFHVSEIFQKAQHAVLYPIKPLYDLKEDSLTEECERVFVRIFRMVDIDQDGLLSSAELKAFQNTCFRVWGPLLDENIVGWNKILSKKTVRRKTKFVRREEDLMVIRDGKFTITGFLAIFEVFMSKDRYVRQMLLLRFLDCFFFLTKVHVSGGEVGEFTCLVRVDATFLPPPLVVSMIVHPSTFSYVFVADGRFHGKFYGFLDTMMNCSCIFHRRLPHHLLADRVGGVETCRQSRHSCGICRCRRKSFWFRCFISLMKTTMGYSRNKIFW